MTQHKVCRSITTIISSLKKTYYENEVVIPIPLNALIKIVIIRKLIIHENIFDSFDHTDDNETRNVSYTIYNFDREKITNNFVLDKPGAGDTIPQRTLVLSGKNSFFS